MIPPGFTLLQVVPELETGGVEQTTLDVAAAVVRVGGRALVASRGGRLEPRLAEVGGELVRLPVHSKNPLIMAANAARLADLIRAEAVSLVHARSRAPAFSALWAARHTSRPFVATYAGIYNARLPLKRWYNAVMTRGDLVIANSAYTRAHVLAEHRVAPDRVVAIPRGIDLVRFDPDAVLPDRVASQRASWGLAPDERRLVFLLAGRLTRWKGQALAAEALARSDVDAVLVLAGDAQGRDDYLNALQGAAAKLGDRLRIVGHCADMPAAYLAADVAIAPSLEPEAFGRTAVEPQAMGRPVLAADHGGARETVVDGVTGLLVVPGSVDAWAAAFHEAAAWSPEHRAIIGVAGRERASRLYAVDAMTDATLAAYTRLLLPLPGPGEGGARVGVAGVGG